MNGTTAKPEWVFGYGSLIYKVDFPFLEKAVANLADWERRFWQGSHDHRGTPAQPGRVVTLVPSPGATCKGIAYLVEPTVFEHLDYREKNGYQRISATLSLVAREQSVSGVVYVADNSNPAFMGHADDEELAAHIDASHGPSGSNRDYLLQLAEALREIGEHDAHVMALESRLVALNNQA